MLHAAFLRSPHARARIRSIDVANARSLPGVRHVLVGQDLVAVASGWRGNSAVLKGFNSPLQRALAVEQVAFQGEAVALVLADTRAIAEDGAELIEVDWEVETATSDLVGAMAEPPAHPELSDNVGFRTVIGSAEDFAKARSEAAIVVEEQLSFGRHTGVPLEARGLIADYNPADKTLTIHHSHQTPNEMQSVFSNILGIEQHRIRIICPDVGGGFGIKLHLYPDEVATLAASILVGRPVKFIADRLESFFSDAHAREHVVLGRIAVSGDGKILGFEVEDICGMGAYSIVARTSISEAFLAVRGIGTPYDFKAFHGSIAAVFQNRPSTGSYRGVGTPIGCAVTEHLVDRAAKSLGISAVDIRRNNLMPPSRMPTTNPCGLRLFDLSNNECFEKILKLMKWEELAQERDRLRGQGIYRGLGLSAYVELTSPGPEINGPGHLPIITVESATVKLEPSGTVRCIVGVSEIGQGVRASLAQIAADAIGISPDAVEVLTGDTAMGTAGGGAWASRGAALGGEAVWRAGRRLRSEILTAAAGLLQSTAENLDMKDSRIVVDSSDDSKIMLRELAEIAYFRGYSLPMDRPPQLSITEQYRRTKDPFIPANAVQASYLEIDVETGWIKLLGHWVVDDCGRIINPLLLGEQVRGGVVQGLGEALFEKLPYDSAGQLLAGTMADYLVPMAGDMPDIMLGHVVTPYSGSELGVKGGAEGGTCGASGAVLNAVNDALTPFDAVVRELPITPRVVLAALGQCAP